MYKLVIFLLFLPSIAWSQCISDIYSVGLERSSIEHDLNKDGSSYAKISSKQSLGVKLGKTWYCPKLKTEFHGSVKANHLTFDKSDGPRLNKFLTEHILFSGGFEIKRKLSQYWEWAIDIQGRHEIGFSANEEEDQLENTPYFNVKLLGGISYYLLKRKKWDLRISPKAGVLFSPDPDAGSGKMVSLNFKSLIKLAGTKSIHIDLYDIQSSQTYLNLENNKRETGVRASLVFVMDLVKFLESL